jgi:hypothetical protein
MDFDEGDEIDPPSLPCEPLPIAPEGFVPHVVSEDMAAYVASAEMPAPISVPSDRELYALSLRQRDPAPIKVERPLNRWIALAMAPWTFLVQVCGIA